jgi:hypothetical protein
MKDRRRTGLVGLLVSLLLALLLPAVAQADNNTTVLNTLNNGSVYVAPSVLSSGHAARGDAKKLQAAVDAAGSHGVPAKVALVMTYPSTIHSPEDGANHLRNLLDFSGVLVLVAPRGVGVSSDYLSSAEVRGLERRAGSRCASSYTACAVEAIQASVPKVQAQQATANRNVAIFWAVAVLVFGVLVGALVISARRRQGKLVTDMAARPADDAPPSPTPQTG